MLKIKKKNNERILGEVSERAMQVNLERCLFHYKIKGTYLFKTLPFLLKKGTFIRSPVPKIKGTYVERCMFH